jgi:hypothetical protein
MAGGTVPGQFVSTAVKNLCAIVHKMAEGTLPGHWVSVALKKMSAIALIFSRNNNQCPMGHTSSRKNNNQCAIGHKILDSPVFTQLV